MRIKTIKVERFRSISNLELDIDKDESLIAVCGKNNVGKTNLLRAINLFFNPEQYDKSVDMTTLKQATGGGTTHPKLTFTFIDDVESIGYVITRDIDAYEKDIESLSGQSFDPAKKRRSLINKNLSSEEIRSVIDCFEFIYIESINVILPELIQEISDEVIDARYYNTKFSNNKKALKESYDNYIDGLREILDSFANDISDTFRSFQPSWSVKFDVPKSSASFRELISNDVTLQLDDQGSVGIEDKGAGLQRLAAILLQFELLERRRNKSKFNIICIDEPDVYIHEGLQRKLRDFLHSKTNYSQIFITTHSKVFLNQYRMKNVFLLDADYRVQHSVRKNRDINVVETKLVDIGTEEGYKKICEHLGIEIQKAEPLKHDNILVEGECDRVYITELARFYGLSIPNIVSVDGVTNVRKYLDFYNSFYADADIKPNVKVLFDNDDAGRTEFKAVHEKNYKNLNLTKVMLFDYSGNKSTASQINHEIEDLVYPEIIVGLINDILGKRGMTQLDVCDVCEKLEKPAFVNGGILSLCENEKNNANLETGNLISLCDTGVKKGMGELFKLEANKPLLDIVEKCDIAHPFVREFISDLLCFEE